MTDAGRERSLRWSDVQRDLERQSFAVAYGTVAAARLAMMSERYRVRADGAASRTLTPQTSQDARPRSLSAVYGMGAQPLHSDGAHMPSPPDLIVLHSSTPSTTSTVIWPLVTLYGFDALRVGVFTVRGNGVTFLASAYENGRIRYDPVVMTPADSLAREAAEYFESERDAALEHSWTEPDTLLFIDNRRALHARSAVVDDADSRVLTRLAYDVPEEP